MAKTNKTVWRSDEKACQDIATGSGAMAVSFDPGGSCKVLQINLHLNTASATSENLTITLDSANGTEYDCNLITKDMNTVKDILINKEMGCGIGEFYMFGSDKLAFAWTNTDARTWGLEIIYRRFKA